MRILEGEHLVGSVLMLAVYVLVGLLVQNSRLDRRIKALVWVGLALRIAGALGRMSIAADARVYYGFGRSYVEYFSRLDFSPFTDPELWLRAQWLGTTFTALVTGLVSVVTSSSWFGSFLAFALIAFLGVAAYARAFRRSFPRADQAHYWGWLMLFPSLWFWPSSIGKEAILMLGLGLVALGFVGSGRRANWFTLAVGVALTYAVRPEVAALMALAVMASYWVNFDRWTASRFVQAVAIVGIAIPTIFFTLGTSEVGGADIETIQGYVEYSAGQANQGGSAIGTTGTGLTAIPMSIVNVLFRPFIWEVHNVSSLFSAVEVLLMWGIIIARRRQLKYVMRIWRRHRTLRFAVPAVLLYVVALGMNLANLGIIARQRTLIFPLFFLIVEAGTMFMPRRKTVKLPFRDRRAPPQRTQRFGGVPA